MKNVKFNNVSIINNSTFNSTDINSNNCTKTLISKEQHINADFGDDFKDNILKFLIDNETGNRLVLEKRQSDNNYYIYMLSKTDKVLGKINIAQIQSSELQEVILHEDEIERPWTLEFKITDKPSIYCSLESIINSLDEEIQRAKNAEDALESAIQVEKTRAIAAETSLQTNLTTEVNRAKNVETALHTEITNESTIRNNKDNELEDRIEALEGQGRFLSSWNAVTGEPVDYPIIPSGATYPYIYKYKVGDYYIVSNVNTILNNYQPTGTSISKTSAPAAWVVGKTVDSREIGVGDYYICSAISEGMATWVWIQNSQKTVTFSQIAGQPKDNTNLNTALDTKLDKITGTSTSPWVYVKKPDGTQGYIVAYQGGPYGNCIPRFDNNGYLYGLTPNNSTNTEVLTNKGYVDNKFVTKSTATTTYDQAYVKKADGSQTMVNIRGGDLDSGNSSNTLVKRDTAGRIQGSVFSKEVYDDASMYLFPNIEFIGSSAISIQSSRESDDPRIKVGSISEYNFDGVYIYPGPPKNEEFRGDPDYKIVLDGKTVLNGNITLNTNSDTARKITTDGSTPSYIEFTPEHLKLEAQGNITLSVPDSDHENEIIVNTNGIQINTQYDDIKLDAGDSGNIQLKTLDGQIKLQGKTTISREFEDDTEVINKGYVDSADTTLSTQINTKLTQVTTSTTHGLIYGVAPDGTQTVYERRYIKDDSDQSEIHAAITSKVLVLN